MAVTPPAPRRAAPQTPILTRSLMRMGRAPLRWLLGWGRIVHFGAVLLVLALTPAAYSRANRDTLLRHLYLDTAPILWWFTALVALLTLIITRIVVVTAISYGLSQYALEMIIRVLVLELIPLTAALFVALRCTIPNGAALSELKRDGRFEALRAHGIDPLTREVLPRVAAGIFSMVTLAALSCVVATVVTYIGVYGFNLAGLPAYTRMFGRVFNPSVSLIFVLKTLLFSGAVALLPLASAVQDGTGDGSRASVALQGLVRLFAVLLLIEMASLVGNYY